MRPCDHVADHDPIQVASRGRRLHYGIASRARALWSVTRELCFYDHRWKGQDMRGRTVSRWFVALAGMAALTTAAALPAGAEPPIDARPGSGGNPANEIAICCTWGPGITDGITYSIDGADDLTASAIQQGIEDWETAIGDADLHFDRVPSGAEVTIRFKRGGGTVAGSTSRTGSGAFITGASMSISGKAFGTTNTGQQLTTVTSHEWGHVLGLNHANGTGLLMSPILDPNVTTIQPCDLAAARVALAWFIPNNTGTPVTPPAAKSC
jgi:hypothetical protein